MVPLSNGPGGRWDRTLMWGSKYSLRPLNFISLNRNNSYQLRGPKLVNSVSSLPAGTLVPLKSTAPNIFPTCPEGCRLRKGWWREAWERRLQGKCGGGMVLGHPFTPQHQRLLGSVCRIRWNIMEIVSAAPWPKNSRSMRGISSGPHIFSSL